MILPTQMYIKAWQMILPTQMYIKAWQMILPTANFTNKYKQKKTKISSYIVVISVLSLN